MSCRSPLLTQVGRTPMEVHSSSLVSCRNQKPRVGASCCQPLLLWDKSKDLGKDCVHLLFLSGCSCREIAQRYGSPPGFPGGCLPLL